MDPEEVLNLFNSYWFDHEIITKQPSSSPPQKNPVFEILEEEEEEEEEETEPKISLARFPTLHTRSRSDQLLIISKASLNPDSPSPKSVLLSPKLRTIFSGKDVIEVTERTTKQEEMKKIPSENMKDRRKRIKGSSKSLSDLEFEELKGFMDLGFVFSEEDKDSRLVSILPGLQRLGKKDGEKDEKEEEGAVDESAIPRPYLSEAWAVLERRRREEEPLMNWRIPAFGNEIDMKHHLRNWAHTVASSVR